MTARGTLSFFTQPQIVHMLFWLFLGGFVWVIGDLFQQFATKYLGIGRGIPLSNTNQLWGLAWGALVFGELAHADATHRILVVMGSVVMIFGALAVSTAIATEREHHPPTMPCCANAAATASTMIACCAPINASFKPVERPSRAPWWDYAILASAMGIFFWLGTQAQRSFARDEPHLDRGLGVILIVSASICAG